MVLFLVDKILRTSQFAYFVFICLTKSLKQLQKHWPEGQNSDEDGLLVDMPSKYEWSQSAEKKAT